MFRKRSIILLTHLEISFSTRKGNLIRKYIIFSHPREQGYISQKKEAKIPTIKFLFPLEPEIFSSSSWPKESLYIHQNGRPSFNFPAVSFAIVYMQHFLCCRTWKQLWTKACDSIFLPSGLNGAYWLGLTDVTKLRENIMGWFITPFRWI